MNLKHTATSLFVILFCLCLCLAGCGDNKQDTALAAPAAVGAKAANGQISVSWLPVEGAVSYNIYYSTTEAVTTDAATAPTTDTKQLVKGLANGVPYYFVVTAMSNIGESVVSEEVSATPSGDFNQSDLTGDWTFIEFFTGSSVTAGNTYGWLRGTVTVDADGLVTVNSVQDSTGTAPPPGSIVKTIDTNGIVTDREDENPDAGNHAVMAANKQLIVGTNNRTVGNPGIVFYVKQVSGVTFSDTDISSTVYIQNQLTTGTTKGWEFSTGSINAARQITVETASTDSGVRVPPPADSQTLFISGNGTVTTGGTEGNATFQGIMTADKSLIIGNETTATGKYTIKIMALGSKNLSTADLNGIWRVHALSTAPFWSYGTYSFDAGGSGSLVEYMFDSGMSGISSKFGLSVDLSGTCTKAGSAHNAYFRGAMAPNKDLLFFNATVGAGTYAMGVAVK